ncbi:MAG: NAD/NADP octopine/nopaline dehydrogenase family protein [Bacillota bacterium]
MMQIDTIAILGAGNGGRAMAADLTLAGFKVNLYELPQFAGSIEHILKSGEIVISGVAREGKAKINLVTTDIAEALYGVELVLLCVPSFGQKMMAEICAPVLRDGMTVVLIPGGFGSFVFYRVLQDLGINKNITLAEVATLPYGARIISPEEVIVHINAINLPTGVFPSTRTAEVIKTLQNLYPAITAAEDILDVALNNVNPCVHPAPSILNTGRIEYADDFYLYREAMTPSVRRVMVAVDRERQAVREAWGYKPPHFGLDPDTYEVFEDYFGRGGVDQAGKKMRGPLSMKDRYITEDIPYGLVLYASAGDVVGVDTPACDALINLASIINKEDYWQTGRTFASLGLENIVPAKLKELLHNG